MNRVQSFRRLARGSRLSASLQVSLRSSVALRALPDSYPSPECRRSEPPGFSEASDVIATLPAVRGDGQIVVELAQLRFDIPRRRRQETLLSRGPGLFLSW